jgi:hypothetical protein
MYVPAPIEALACSDPTDRLQYRLLLSGLYPVEFRDFFLGDIWCSLTYATCVRGLPPFSLIGPLRVSGY